MAELGFLDYFSTLEDPRVERCKLYPMAEIFFLTLLAVICGAEGWEDIELLGHSKLALLRRYLPYSHGIPSDDTLRRFFRAIDPKAFQECFISWVNSLDIPVAAGVIAIDGKTSRRSHDGDKRALHLVSAFASEARIVLGQLKTHEKSNEITAIPQLIDLLDIRSHIVTIDALGTQREIAAKIIEKGGDYTHRN
jgi:predicted transposase YbfD/YdcC